MSQTSHLMRILSRIEHASKAVTRKYPHERYLIPQRKRLNCDEDIVAQINRHILFLEQREQSYMMFKK